MSPVYCTGITVSEILIYYLSIEGTPLAFSRGFSPEDGFHHIGILHKTYAIVICCCESKNRALPVKFHLVGPDPVFDQCLLQIPELCLTLVSWLLDGAGFAPASNNRHPHPLHSLLITWSCSQNEMASKDGLFLLTSLQAKLFED